MQLPQRWQRKGQRIANTTIPVGAHEHLQDRLYIADLIIHLPSVVLMHIQKTVLADYPKEFAASTTITDQVKQQANGQRLSHAVFADPPLAVFQCLTVRVFHCAILNDERGHCSLIVRVARISKRAPDDHYWPVNSQHGEQSRALASARSSRSEIIRVPCSMREMSCQAGFHAPLVTCAMRAHSTSCPSCKTRRRSADLSAIWFSFPLSVLSRVPPRGIVSNLTAKYVSLWQSVGLYISLLKDIIDRALTLESDTIIERRDKCQAHILLVDSMRRIRG